ncbi:MAG: hypothetical protein AAF890_00245 [Pseudomonadota bacterium]
MSQLKKIEDDVKSLNRKDAKAFAQWFERWQADLWDEEIGADVASGRFDQAVEQAKLDARSGKLRPL